MIFLESKYILQLIVKVFYGLLTLFLTSSLKISNLDPLLPRSKLTNPSWQKSMCLAAASGVAVAAAKLLLARWESWYMY